MTDPTKPLPISQPENNGKTTQKTGFQLNPSGINRAGRPKKDWTWADLIAEAAEEMIETKGKDGTITGRRALKKLVARKLLTMAAGGNVPAAREIMNRTDGMPLQAHDITSAGEKLVMPHVTVDIKPEES